jgi:hypothetical protein
MDLTNILQQLRAERDKISAAISSLQAITAGAPTQKRRGRPPKNAAASYTEQDPSAAPTEKKQRSKRTKAQREAQAERMRQYWAERKAQG